MVTIGQLPAFQADNERITDYLEGVQLFYEANGIKEGKRVPVLLTAIGGKTYALLSNLLAPQKPSTKSFNELSTILKDHFKPKPVIIAERFHFHRRNQAAGETVAEYLAELRRLATHCEFKDYLSEALRDRLVCGLRSESIQKNLLACADLMLAKAIEVAQSMEAAETNAQQLKGELRVGKVANGSTAETAAGEKPCHRCGRRGHKEWECRFKDFICNHCKKKGHLARVCRSRTQT